MCIKTSLTTQLAMQLQQSMLQRSATTSNTPVNTSIPGHNYSPFNSPDAPQYRCHAAVCYVGCIDGVYCPGCVTGICYTGYQGWLGPK
jgi:hypothetical protein